MRLLFAALLSSLCALPLAAAPLHAQYLPADDAQLRQGEPVQQQLMQVIDFSVVAGNERLSNEQPIPITAPLTVRLKGKPVAKGGNLAEVLITFDNESKSLKKANFDEASKTLSLNYPLIQYRVIMELLRSDTVYVQYLTYQNGHVWADLHTTGGRAR